MSPGQLAALIAAGFFAAGVCAAGYVLFRLARLISAATRMVTDYGNRASALIERAQAAIDRTNEQLARTDNITASMDEVTANMASLSGHVSALAGMARGVSSGLGGPVLRVFALAFGIRRAVELRLGGETEAMTPRQPAGALPAPPAAGLGGAPGQPRALPGQRSRAGAGRDGGIRR